MIVVLNRLLNSLYPFKSVLFFFSVPIWELYLYSAAHYKLGHLFASIYLIYRPVYIYIYIFFYSIPCLSLKNKMLLGLNAAGVLSYKHADFNNLR